MQPSRLGKQDEHGLSLLHYAAMNNHPQIIAQLLIQSMDVNVRRNNIMGTGKRKIVMLYFKFEQVSVLEDDFVVTLEIQNLGWILMIIWDKFNLP